MDYAPRLKVSYNLNRYIVYSLGDKYTLYDGPDALIANKLLELGLQDCCV